MAHISGQIVIHRPIDEVFDIVADERNEPRDNPQMIAAERVANGPIGPGARFRAALRALGRPTDTDIEVVDYQRPTRLRSKTVLSNMDIDGALRFDPLPDRTRMMWDWTVEPHGTTQIPHPTGHLHGAPSGAAHLEESQGLSRIEVPGERRLMLREPSNTCADPW